MTWEIISAALYGLGMLQAWSLCETWDDKPRTVSVWKDRVATGAVCIAWPPIVVFAIADHTFRTIKRLARRTTGGAA